MKKVINLNNRKFERIKQRAYTPVQIYRGQNEFLRIGPSQILDKEFKLHKQLLSMGFPLAKVSDSGHLKNQSYFIENSLGNFHFGQIFSKDCTKFGKISDKNFEAFLKIVVRFAQAQILTKNKSKNYESFFSGIHLPEILNELPKLSLRTKQAIKKIRNKTRTLPFVVTHGDFGPFNIYPEGVIDLESFFEAPIGYDLVVAIYMTDFFPKQRGFEISKIYWFTEKQIKKYFKKIDNFFKINKLPMLSNFVDEFILIRCFWAAVRMQKWPKLQKWRYSQYERLLFAYLKGKDLKEYL